MACGCLSDGMEWVTLGYSSSLASMAIPYHTPFAYVASKNKEEEELFPLQPSEAKSPSFYNEEKEVEGRSPSSSYFPFLHLFHSSVELGAKLRLD
jgi:hypothetical protein